jgi:hypothetical protein
MGQIIRNPYKMIMMNCPVTGKPVKTGVNSAYFETWGGNPPPGGATFACPDCGQKHSFDKTNTWLQDLSGQQRGNEESTAEQILRARNDELSQAAQDKVTKEHIDVVRELESIRKIAFADPRTNFLTRVSRKFIGGDGLAFSPESHYRAAALLVLSKFPDVTISWIMRNAPRPHGGRIWRAMADIGGKLPDKGVDMLLGPEVQSAYPGIQRFKNSGSMFIPATESQLIAAAEAWKLLILTQDELSEARKLVQQMVVSCSIGERIMQKLQFEEPKLAEALTH